jgi:hypothetical protein
VNLVSTFCFGPPDRRKLAIAARFEVKWSFRLDIFSKPHTVTKSLASGSRSITASPEHDHDEDDSSDRNRSQTLLGPLVSSMYGDKRRQGEIEVLAIKDIYQDVTDRIVNQLEKGVSPWGRPWEATSQALPRNVISGAEYRGVKFWLLGLAAEERGWHSSLFGTYRQWQQLGGHVRRGELRTRIVFWNVLKREAIDDESGKAEERRRFFARCYTVFALEQCGGESLDRFRQPVV